MRYRSFLAIALAFIMFSSFITACSRTNDRMDEEAESLTETSLNIKFGEQLHEEILDKVPHRQWVFSIPKRLRPYFMYDRKLLSKLSLCT